MAAIVEMDNEITDGLIATVTDFVQNTMNWVGPIYLNLVVIYIAILGYSLWAGKIQFPLRDLIIHLFKIALVSTFALGLGWYSSHVITLAFDGPHEVLNGITGTTDNTVSALDGLWQDITDSANSEWDECGFTDVDACGQALMLWLAGVITCTPIFFVIVFSKIMLSMVLILGPIFIVAALFKKGVRFTEGWVTQFLNFFFLYVLIILLGHLAADLLQRMADGAQQSQVTDQSFSLAMELILVSLLLAGAAFVMPFLASALAGGIAAPVSAGLAYIPGGGQILRTLGSLGGRQGSSGKSRPGGDGYLKRWGGSSSRNKRK